MKQINVLDTNVLGRMKYQRKMKGTKNAKKRNKKMF